MVYEVGSIPGPSEVDLEVGRDALSSSGSGRRARKPNQSLPCTLEQWLSVLFWIHRDEEHLQQVALCTQQALDLRHGFLMMGQTSGTCVYPKKTTTILPLKSQRSQATVLILSRRFLAEARHRSMGALNLDIW